MARRVPQGPPPPPAVQRIRIRYAKRGRLRFSSHRDFARAFERALRRAEAPMAFSAGFSPHQKISYLGAAPTGVASEAEYLEIALSRAVDPDALRAALDAALPPGLDIVEAVESAGAPIAALLQASCWRLEFPGVDPARLSEAIAAFLAAPEAPVERATKDGRRTLDARGPVVSASCQPGDGGSCAIMQLVVRQMIPAVRPDDVLAALRAVAGFVPQLPPRVTRVAYGPLDEAGRVGDPLAADRTAAGASPTT
ncbi:MAG: TIGR03936 family radical SAM-associated protein [Frankiaceae bacterium]|nr:TIGR03936 family radical SAM-associated protein [Frankiaceae bacterium]